MISMAKNMHTYKYTRHSKTAENFLEAFANLSMLEGNQPNETHTISYVAGGQGEKNIYAVMKAVE